MDINSSSHPLLKALQLVSLSNLESTIPTLELGDLLTIDSNSPKVLQSLEHTSLSNFSSSITELTLSQLIDIDVTDPDTPQIMIALKDVKVLDGTSLTNKINNLKLNDIYKESECDGIFKYLWDDNDSGNLLITDIPNAVNNLPLVKILEDYIYIDDANQAKYYDEIDDAYYSYSQLVGGLSPSGHEVIEYKRIQSSGLENLTLNFTYHMQTETLYELYDSGVLDSSVLARTDLDKQFVDPNTHTIRIVGNLTMSEFLAICIQLLPSLPNP